MHSIIISADDFGKSALANKNILNLVKQGRMQRVSVMVNREINKEEVNKLLESKVKLDIHLELSKENKEYIGTFIRSFLFIGRLLVGKNSVKQVANSWENQVEKFISIFNQIPSGLNSHEHVHFFPPYFKIALKLCEKYKIDYLRFGNKGILTSKSTTGFILKLLNSINKQKFATYDLPASPAGRRLTTYDYLCSMDWIKNYKSFLNNLPDGNTEIVCHPEREIEYERLVSGK